MNIFDIGIILLFVMSLIIGFKRGFIKEIVPLVGIILIFIISFTLKGIIGNLLCQILPFFNFSGSLEGITSLNILLYQLIAFLVIFAILSSLFTIILKLSSIFQKILHLTIIFWLPSKLAGAITAFLSCYIIFFIVLLTLIIPLKENSLYQNSFFINKIIYHTPLLSNYTNNITTSINEIYLLSEDLQKQRLSTNDANLKTIDIMLKYKVVNKKTVSNLLEKGKLSISNIDTILNKYEE